MTKKLDIPEYEKLISLDRALICKKTGKEICNPVPNEFPSKIERPSDMVSLMRRVVREEADQRARSEGVESFKDANDFEVPDDFDTEILTEYELMDHEAENLLDWKQEIQDIADEERERQAEIEAQQQVPPRGDPGTREPEGT